MPFIPDPIRAVLTVLLSVVLVSLIPSPAAAQQKAASIAKGEYPGTWVDCKVRYTIEEVHDETHFDGIAEFLEDYDRIKFGIHGAFGKDGSLVLTRYTWGSSQVGRSAGPKITGERRIYSGPVKGIGVGDEGKLSFEIRLPLNEEDPVTAARKAHPDRQLAQGGRTGNEGRRRQGDRGGPGPSDPRQGGGAAV